MLVALLVVILVRVFLFEPFTIPSASMEGSLMTGDYVLVSKLSYGPRIPNTPLSFPFAHQHLPFTENTPSFLTWIKLPYWRLFGSPDPERGDVVVFNYPMEDELPVDQRTYYIKRCVGLAGDTLEVKNGLVFINGQEADEPSRLQFNYKVFLDTDTINSDSVRLLGIREGGKLRNPGEYWFTLDPSGLDKMKQLSHVKNIEPLLEKKGSYSDYMFPENEHFLWNVDFFGPLYIPRAGDSVHLTVDSLPLYERIIRNYEHNELRVQNDSIFINGIYSQQYHFKMNYFFMMGDNRHNSADSRFWGFVPEDHIVGKAIQVLMSVDRSESGTHLRSDRWFHSIP